MLDSDCITLFIYLVNKFSDLAKTKITLDFFMLILCENLYRYKKPALPLKGLPADLQYIKLFKKIYHGLRATTKLSSQNEVLHARFTTLPFAEEASIIMPSPT